MSDDLATFKRKTEAMFAAAERRMHNIGVRFAVAMAWRVIDATPGPNNQLPETEYIATGRLRASFRYSSTPLGNVSRIEGGPYTEHGVDTLEVFAAAVAAHKELPGAFYLVSDVAYGYIVHEGIGRMPFPRPWVQIEAGNMQSALREALS